MRSCALHLLLMGGAILAASIYSPKVSATSSIYSSATWETQVVRADFIGVVVCQVAGGDVAKYKVIESWKGTPKKNDILYLQNLRGAAFPISLCDARYVVCASQATRPDAAKGHMKLSDPLMGRYIPVDFQCLAFREYDLSPYIGEMRLTEDGRLIVGLEEKGYQAFRRTVTEIVSLSPEKQEERVLRSLCEKYIFGLRGDPFRYSSVAEEYNRQLRRFVGQSPALLSSIRTRIDAADSVEALVRVIAEVQGAWDLGLEAVLFLGGGPLTLAYLEQLTEKEWEPVVRSIRWRLFPSQGKKEDSESLVVEKPKADDPLILHEKPNSRHVDRFSNAFIRLTWHDPETVAEFLSSWEYSRLDDLLFYMGFGVQSTGYSWGSYFGRYCGSERMKHLEILTEAKDDFIRVAAAVYLTLENEALGMDYLERFRDLEGDPGAWAALNLARRGRKEAMPRALQVFDSSPPLGRTYYHKTLQKRLLVLLSNSCKASGTELPMIHYGHGYGAAHKKNLEWWTEIQGQIAVHDPWLETFKKQNVD